MSLHSERAMSAGVFELNPLRDSRWGEFLLRHPHSSAFHTSAWLRALRQTYGYEPFALSTTPPDAPLTNAVVFCRIRSFLTGTRLTSLPFADHCCPLVSDPGELDGLLRQAKEMVDRQSLSYVEVRGGNEETSLGLARAGFKESETYACHLLDLRPELSTIFARFHKSCVQRKIRRAERAALEYRAGNSDELIHQFYRLLTITRRRHGVPPQPVTWFMNLRNTHASALMVHSITQSGVPIASIVIVRHKQTLLYKYGASDARFHNLGGMVYLFWRVMQESKELGLEYFDLGRSDWSNPGLIAFKQHLGAQVSTLTYYRHPPPAAKASGHRTASIMRAINTHLPLFMLRTAGRLLYRHVG